MRTAAGSKRLPCALGLALAALVFPAHAATPMVSMGQTHALSLRADGTVLAWGSDRYGQLGVNRPLIATSAVMVPGLSNVKSITAGNAHALAVRQDGTLWAWGDNTFGQLGDGTNVDRSSPVQVPGIADAVMACGGGAHSAVLKRDGTVWAWGNNWYGQRGDGTQFWYSAPPGPVTGLSGVTSIACYGNQTIALLQNGTVRAWGENAYGQLGDGTTTDRFQPVPVSGLNQVVAINGTAALKSDGTVWEWGYCSWSGQQPNLFPVQSSGIGGATALGVNLGGIYGARLDAIGGVAADGTTSWWEWTPGGAVVAQAPMAGLKAIASAHYHTLLLKADGTVLASGLNNHGELGNGLAPSSGWNWQSNFVPVVGLANAVAIAAGSEFSLALDANGRVWAWGDDSHGQLGRGATLTSTVPAVVPGLSNIVQVVAGGEGTSLAVDESGSVWAWGLNYHGQLGDGSNTNRSTPVRLTEIQDVAAVSIGAVTSMALKRDGTVWTWGNNFVGQLGNAGAYSGSFSTTPAPVAGLSHILAIAANTHMLAVKDDGSVWAWGGNSNGQLGLGTNTDATVPVQIPGLTGVKSVAVTVGRSFALKTDGSVMAWGSGALGDGPWRVAGQLTPIAVPGLTDIVEIAPSYYHNLARSADGSVWGWGATWAQGSALGRSPHSDTPIPISTPAAVRSLATGGGDNAGGVTTLLGQDGLVYLGGANAFGQLGDGTFALHADFVLAVAPGLDGFLNLSSGATLNVPAALQVPFFVSSTGGISASAAVVKTTVKFKAADVEQPGAVFVTAMVPPGSLVPVASALNAGGTPGSSADTAASAFALIQLTPTGWQPVVGGQLLAYAAGMLGDQLSAQTILNGTDTSALKGAQFCLGYGTSAEQMIAAGTMRTVASIPDPNATITGASSCIVAASNTPTTTSTSTTTSTTATTTTTTITTTTATTTTTTTSTTTSVPTTTTTEAATTSTTGTTTTTLIYGTTTTTLAPITTTTTTTSTTTAATTTTTQAPATTTTSTTAASTTSTTAISTTTTVAATTTTTQAVASTTTTTSTTATSTTTTSTTTTTPASTTTTSATTSSIAASVTNTTQASATTTTTAGATTTTLPVAPVVHVTPGWNLVGNSVDAVLDVVASFGDAAKVSTIWKWITARATWAFYAPALADQGGTALQDYAASKGYDVLAAINGGEGFWVNAKQAFDFTLPAATAISVSRMQIALTQGWNLVCIGETRSVREFNTALGYNLTTLWNWDNPHSGWYFYSPRLDVGGLLPNYLASKGYLDFTDSNRLLGPGVGFWVNRP